MESNRKTILVTGGAGFIGSHLCERLVRDGHKVISLDNYFTGSRDNHVDGVIYREGHTKHIERLIPETPDLVFHLGEYSRVEKSFEDIETLWDLNKTGTFAVLEFCRKKKAKIVYAGSSTKFADGGLGRDQSPYAWAKASNTELVRNYASWFQIPYAITYFFNVYGGRERGFGPYATVVGIFKEQYKRGQPITVVAPGTQIRNFTHIDDTIEGLVLVGEKGEGDEYGIGNDAGYSVLDVAKLFPTEIMTLPERKGNRQTSVVDTTRVRGLGWTPKVNLKEHIASFIEITQPHPKGERRVLVFSTTFHPHMGKAERALEALIKSMPDLHFDIVTTLFSKDAKDVPSPLPNATIHRVGKGNRFDKFLLPILGYQKAYELSRKQNHLFGWSLLASYGALAAVFLRRKHKLPLLITLADQRLKGVPEHMKFLMRFILGNADQVYASNAEDQKHVSTIAERARVTRSLGAGDAFANQIRFAYQGFLNKEIQATRK